MPEPMISPTPSMVNVSGISDQAPDRHDLVYRVASTHFLDDDILDREQKLAGTHDCYRLQQGAHGDAANQILMMSSP